MEYLSLYVYHKLDKALQKAVVPFRSGFNKVIDTGLIEIFNEEELEVLVSGGRTPINIRDLQNNCNYSGGYKASQKYIRTFWNEVDKFTPEEKTDFLKFVTCYQRPPLLGFAHLEPKFTIQMAQNGNEGMLPQAATCFNALKLPKYSKTKTMVGKIKEAIKHNTGYYIV